jgi:hypothetical protein
MHASPGRIGDWISTAFARSLGPHFRPAGGSAKSSLTSSLVACVSVSARQFASP